MTIDISLSSILRVVGVAVAVFFVVSVADLLLLLVFALVLASSITPFINAFEDKGVPRIVSLLAVIALLLGIVTLMAISVVPPLVAEFQGLAENVPVYRDLVADELQKLGVFDQNTVVGEGVGNVLNNITKFFGEGASSFSGFVFSIFGGVVSTVTVLLATFYLALDRNGVEKFLRLLTPDREETYIVDLWRRAQTKIAHWAKGQLILMLLMGSLTFVVLELLGVKFALVLATLAAFMEVVPYVGAIVAGAAAVGVALFQSPWLALAVLVIFILMQQLESQIVIPLLYRRLLKLHPVVIIFALMIGARFGGLAGMIIAIPVTTVLTEFLTDFAAGKVK